MPNNCYCDQTGLGDPTQTCGDCPEDYRERPQGHPQAADELERLGVNAETIEFARSASRLLYGFMLDCNSVGVHAAGENLARGLKHQMSVIAQRGFWRTK